MRRYVLSPKGRRLHRTLGLIFGIYLVTAALSGIAHNVIALAFPPPPPAQTPGDIALPTAGITPAEAARVAGGATTVAAIDIRMIGGQAVYQLVLPGATNPIYIDAASGTRRQDVDARYAAEIAGRALPGRLLTNTAYLTAFDDEYSQMYRTLPVYRFDAAGDDGARIYVSTATGGVTFWTNDARQALGAVFRNLHMLSFLGNHPAQMWILIVFAVGATAMAGLGLAMVWARDASRRNKA